MRSFIAICFGVVIAALFVQIAEAGLIEFFELTDGHNKFVFRLFEGENKQIVKDIISGAETKHKYIRGHIFKNDAMNADYYNPNWKIILRDDFVFTDKPPSKECDHTLRDMEDHFDDICKHGCDWCPSSVKIIREIPLAEIEKLYEEYRGYN